MRTSRSTSNIKNLHALLAFCGSLTGKRVVAPTREVLEARNALAVYERLDDWVPAAERDFLAAHTLLMKGLLDAPGHYHTGGVGVMAVGSVVHMAPPASRVPVLMRDLLGWLGKSDLHALESGLRAYSGRKPGARASIRILRSAQCQYAAIGRSAVRGVHACPHP